MTAQCLFEVKKDRFCICYIYIPQCPWPWRGAIEILALHVITLGVETSEMFSAFDYQWYKVFVVAKIHVNVHVVGEKCQE